MRRRPVVAIDGPAGAGKSTVARGLADRLQFTLVDTGALYRVVALSAVERGIALDDEPALTALVRALVEASAIGLQPSSGGNMIVLLESRDVSAAIRTAPMGMAASTVSRVPGVRAGLLELQRNAGREGGVVLEGRDIGTVVFPDAEIKFFLTADTAVRAQRRFEELLSKGEAVQLESTLAEVKARDRQDSERPLAPLKAADDAIRLDSSTLTVEEIIEAMAARVSAYPRNP